MGHESGVSEIVGEMLLLAIVLVLLAVFSSSLSNYLPPPRDPSVTIRMSPLDADSHSVTIEHLGGDILRTEDLFIIKSNSTTNVKNKINTQGFKNITQPGFFGLSDIYCLNSTSGFYIAGDDEITLSTSRSVIFKGTV